MASATCSGVTTYYVYDGEGQRVAKLNASGAVTEQDVYNTSGQVLMRYNASGSWLEGEVWAGGSHLAIYANSQTYFPLSDQVGTERARFSYTGGIVQTCMSQPFGDNLNCTGTDSSPYKFGKLERDTETNDDHAQHRDYNSNPYRWLTPDPAGEKVVVLTDPQTWNLYAYVGDNPVGRGDPNGLADFYVFLPLVTNVSGSWSAIREEAPRYGNTVTIFPGDKATAAAYLTAVRTPGANVVFAGHTVEYAEQPSGRITGGSVQLKDAKGGDEAVGIAQHGGNSSVITCAAYNYYQDVATPSSCNPSSPPTQGLKNNGNVMGYYYVDNYQSEFSHQATYFYDGVNRLTCAFAQTLGASMPSNCSGSSALWGLSYGYDQYGFLKTATATAGSPPTLSLGTDGNNHINNTNFTYDAAGNMTQDGSGTNTHQYQWDAEGRLTTVDLTSNGCGTGNTNDAACYVYNALGQRVQGTYGGSAYHDIMELLYDPAGELVSRCEAGGSTGSGTCWYDSFVNLGGRAVASYWSGNGSFFGHVDNLGTATLITSASGAPGNDTRFYPFGQIWMDSGSFGWDFQFALMQAPDTNFAPLLMPTDFRSFHSTLGRWMSPDPLAGDITNPQSLNRYAYVMNNPCSLVDPFGLGPCNFRIAISAPALHGNVVADMEARIQDVLTSAGVGAEFVRGNQSPDFLVSVNTGAPQRAGDIGWDSGLGNLAYVYQNAIAPDLPVGPTPPGFGRVLGQVAAHEFGHWALGIYDPAIPPATPETAGIMYNRLDLQDVANGVVRNFTYTQVPALQGACSKLHPPSSQSGGGGGAGGAGGEPSWMEEVWFSNPGAFFTCPEGWTSDGHGECYQVFTKIIY